MWPYVEVKVLGVSGSRTLKTHITSTAGGFHAVWNVHLSFEVEVPQLAFVRFEVRDSLKGNDQEDDPVLASYTSRLLCLRSGVCTVPLVSADRSLSKQPPRLFVRVDLQFPNVPIDSRL